MPGSNIRHEILILTLFGNGETEFLGVVMRLREGSCWKLTKALSNLAYQQANPPFEARQVFTCICIHDPEGRYTEVSLAVVKVKYQWVFRPSSVNDLADGSKEYKGQRRLSTLWNTALANGKSHRIEPTATMIMSGRPCVFANSSSTVPCIRSKSQTQPQQTRSKHSSASVTQIPGTRRTSSSLRSKGSSQELTS